jgi:hypothetical protein
MRKKILLKVALNTITLALTQRIIWENERKNIVESGIKYHYSSPNSKDHMGK